MDPTIIVALIGFVGSIISIWATYKANSNKITREFEKTNAEYQKQAAAADAKLEKQLAVMETKLESLSSEVRGYKEVTNRLVVVEQKLKDLTEFVKK